MINQQEISIGWINSVSKTNRNADKILVEKVIRALLLLEGLVKQKLPFIFKGGTALMLHLNSTKRLSIDIDIILPQKHDNLVQIFDKVSEEQGFVRMEQQHRSALTKIRKEHYRFFYVPLHKSNKEEEYVLLDITFEGINYSKIIQLPIQSVFVPIKDTPLLVDVPCVEDLLGDKLTAFAPNTTGIPYFKNEHSMSMEIIKQLYDIGNLHDIVFDMGVIKETFYRIAATELIYRNIERLRAEDVLDDIYQTSLCIASRGIIGKGDFEQLQSGIRRISTFLFSENYHIEKAIVSASKAAYLATLIKYSVGSLEKFGNPLEMKEWLIDLPLYGKLNKLKKSNPEAFFYWYKIFELTAKAK